MTDPTPDTAPAETPRQELDRARARYERERDRFRKAERAYVAARSRFDASVIDAAAGAR